MNVINRIVFFVCCMAVALGSIVPEWDEQARVGNMIVSETLPSDHNYAPYVGNGYLASNVLGDSLYVAGLFNGQATKDPSHRARIQNQLAVTLSSSSPAVKVWAHALDIHRGAFFSRALLAGEATVEFCWYAPRHMPHVSVLDLTVNASNAMSTTTLQLKVNSGSATKDISFVSAGNPPAGVLALLGKTITPEDPQGGAVQGVAVAYSTVPSTLTVAAHTLITFRFVLAAHTTLDTSWETLVDSAIVSHTAALSRTTLFGDHAAAWQNIWQSGIDIGGNMDLAQKVNASLYYILASVRPDWNYGLSPGSLSSNSYNGHGFWDTETWMYPTMCLLYPEIAASLLQYRIDRIDGAIRKAKSYSPPFCGAMYPWESALTGLECTPTWAATGLREIHINGDISLAAWQYYNQTHDLAWLTSALPMLEGIADYWVSKVVNNTATNEFEILDVIPPDEYVDHVKNSVYTNVAARISLQVAILALKLLGHSVPVQYEIIASNIRIPFDAKLGIHPEYDGYTGATVKQADVVLLGYPLMLPMSREVRRNDLLYYSSRTDPGGPSMTWGMHAVGLLELGDVANATTDFTKSQLNMRTPFNVWSETTTGGAVNFITGAGGFLQGVWAGYGGLRIHDASFVITPRLPPNSSSLGLRGIALLGAKIDVHYDGTTTSLLARTAPTVISSLCVQSLSSSAQPTVLIPGRPVSFHAAQDPTLLVRGC